MKISDITNEADQSPRPGRGPTVTPAPTSRRQAADIPAVRTPAGQFVGSMMDPGAEDFAQAARDKNYPAMAVAGITAIPGIGKLAKLAKLDKLASKFGKGGGAAADVVKRDVDIPAPRDYSAYEKGTAASRKAAPAPPADVPMTPRTGSRAGKELDLPKPGQAPAAKPPEPVAAKPAEPVAAKPPEPVAAKPAEPAKSTKPASSIDDQLAAERLKQEKLKTKHMQRELPPSKLTYPLRNPGKSAAWATGATVAGGTAYGAGELGKSMYQDYKTQKAKDPDQEWGPGGYLKRQAVSAIDAGIDELTGKDSSTKPPSTDASGNGKTDPSWVTDASPLDIPSSRENPNVVKQGSDYKTSELPPKTDYDASKRFKDDPYFKNESAVTEAAPDKDAAVRQFLTNVIRAESGGRNIKNLTGSSAYGVAQFIPSTFKGLVKQAQPGTPLYGKTWNDYKKDVELQKQALVALTNDNIRNLEKNKIPITPGTLYMLHHFGPKGVDMIKSGPTAKLSNIFPEYVNTRDKRTGEVKQILNPVYAQNPQLKPDHTVKTTYDRLSSAVGDKKSQQASVKDKAIKVGTNVLAAVTGSGSAQAADELPKSATKTANAKPAAKEKPAAPVTNPSQPAVDASNKVQSAQTAAVTKAKAEPKQEPTDSVKFEPIAFKKAEPIDFKSANPQIKGVMAASPPIDKIDVSTDLQKDYGQDVYKPASADWRKDLPDNALSTASSSTNKEPDEQPKKVPVPESINTAPNPELQEILRLAGKQGK